MLFTSQYYSNRLISPNTLALSPTSFISQRLKFIQRLMYQLFDSESGVRPFPAFWKCDLSMSYSVYCTDEICVMSLKKPRHLVISGHQNLLACSGSVFLFLDHLQISSISHEKFYYSYYKIKEWPTLLKQINSGVVTMVAWCTFLCGSRG